MMTSKVSPPLTDAVATWQSSRVEQPILWLWATCGPNANLKGPQLFENIARHYKTL